MGTIDKRGKLLEKPFSFRTTKDGKLFIHWHERQNMVLKGSSAEKFISSIDKTDSQQAQLIMAKVTGHFKHGNERSA